MVAGVGYIASFVLEWTNTPLSTVRGVCMLIMHVGVLLLTFFIWRTEFEEEAIRLTVHRYDELMQVRADRRERMEYH